MATHSSVLVCRIPMDRGAWWARVPKSWTQLKQISTHTRGLYNVYNDMNSRRVEGKVQGTTGQ